MNFSPHTVAPQPGLTPPALPAVSVGFLSYNADQTLLLEVCNALLTAAQRYGADVDIIAVNTGGLNNHRRLVDCLAAAQHPGDSPRLSSRVLDAAENNISTGRNLLLTSAKYPIICMFDDDEIVSPNWIGALVGTHLEYGAAIVAGPVFCEFPVSSPRWMQSLDLHESRGRDSGQRLQYCSSCNVLLDRDSLGVLRFDRKFGKSGGEDLDFFLRATQLGHVLIWSNDALVKETIPQGRASLRWLAQRFMKQGQIYIDVMVSQGIIRSSLLHRLRAVPVFILALFLSFAFRFIDPPKSAKWLKRALTNLGKFTPSTRSIYAD